MAINNDFFGRDTRYQIVTSNHQQHEKSKILVA